MSTSTEDLQPSQIEHHLPSNYTPFILLTPRLLLAPTPSLLSNLAYRTLYASLHAIPEFCEMGFGPDWGPKVWDEQEAYEMVAKEVERNWAVRRLGDFGMGLWSGEREGKGRVLDGVEEWGEIRLVQGEELEQLVKDGLWEQVEWAGYAGVREARLPPLEEGDDPRPSWLERGSPFPRFSQSLQRRAHPGFVFRSRRASIRPLSCSLGQRACTRVCENRLEMGSSRARRQAIHRRDREAQR